MMFTRNRNHDMNPITLQSDGRTPVMDFLQDDVRNMRIGCPPGATPMQFETGAPLQGGAHYRDHSVAMPWTAPHEFEGTGQLVHKNVADKVAVDTLVEYTIVVDSADRDISKYPNPFHYRVYFNPVSNTKDAYIYRTFENVKYIKLETAIMPRRYYFVRNDVTDRLNEADVSALLGALRDPNSTVALVSPDLSGNHAIIEDYVDAGVRIVKFARERPYPEVVDRVYELRKEGAAAATVHEFALKSYSLEDEKFLLLYIDEFKDVNDLATNQETANAFSMLFPDFVNGDYYYTDTHYVDKIFRFSSLGNISSFTIRVANPDGKVFQNQHDNAFVDMHADRNKRCECRPDANGNYARNYRCSCTYLRHPFFCKFQNTLVFKVGVIENDMDKAIFS
jgi:hypothetical protein